MDVLGVLKFCLSFRAHIYPPQYQYILGYFDNQYSRPFKLTKHKKNKKQKKTENICIALWGWWSIELVLRLKYKYLQNNFWYT